MFRRLIFLFIFLGFVLSLSYAEEILILYTGSTESSLYPIYFEKKFAGGISRRSSLIKRIRNNVPFSLLLDAGNFFAQPEQGTSSLDLYKLRTQINLKAMRLMQYDAVNIGLVEFSLGEDFLIETIKNAGLEFVSSNLVFSEPQSVKPYIIKELAGIKFAILGIGNPSAMDRAKEIKFKDPLISLKNIVKEIKGKVDFIIVLSSLGEYQDRRIIEQIEGIDIIINAGIRENKESYTKLRNTLLLRCSMKGTHLGKLLLNIKDKKIKSFKVEEILISDKIKEDPQIVSFLPACFSDNDCQREVMLGVCESAGTPQAQCLFKSINKIKLTVIIPKDCRVCDTTSLINLLKKDIPHLDVSYLYYPDKKIESLLSQLGVNGLPVYLLDKTIEKEKSFLKLKNSLKDFEQFYMILPEYAGMSYLLNRTPIKDRIDLFISLYDEMTAGLLEAMREFRPEIHFLAIQSPEGEFEAKLGNLEVEDYLRAVCIKKYYPQYFWDYLICRAKNIFSSWWDECLIKDMDYKKIKECAKSKEAEELLKENISLNAELKIMFGPVYLLENYEIFSSRGVPSKEEIQKVLRKR